MTTNLFPITIELTSSQFQRLRATATKLSKPGNTYTVPELVEELVDRALTPKTSRQYDTARRDLSVLQLHRQGMNDRAIARQLHCHPATIYRARQRLHLGPNDPRGGDRRPHEGAPDVSRS